MLSYCLHIAQLFKHKFAFKKERVAIVRILGWIDGQKFPPVCIPCNGFTAQRSDLNNLSETDQ